MVFSTPYFLFLYLPIVLVLYYISPLKWRNFVLLVVNLVFYGWGEPVYILIMFVSIAIDYMAGDGNGPGGAWYPEAMDTWESQSRVVSSGNYVMMVVNGSCDSIVSDFKALF